MKKKKYIKIPRIENQIAELEEQKRLVMGDARDINRQLNKLYKKKTERDSIESVSIRIGDLKTELEAIVD